MYIHFIVYTLTCVMFVDPVNVNYMFSVQLLYSSLICYVARLAPLTFPGDSWSTKVIMHLSRVVLVFYTTAGDLIRKLQTKAKYKIHVIFVCKHYYYPDQLNKGHQSFCNFTVCRNFQWNYCANILQMQNELHHVYWTITFDYKMYYQSN